jgi:hypothetical protein
MGRLASSALALCSMSDGAAGGAGDPGGAASLFGGDAAGGGTGGDGGGAAGGGTGGDGGGVAGGGTSGGGGSGGGGGDDPEWLQQFSAEGGQADNPSNRDWLKAKGFKSLDDLAKSYREAEHAIRNGGKLTVPGEGAKPEEIAAFNKAIGVPEKPDGYEIALPDGVSEDDLDGDLVSALPGLAHQAGVPAKAYKSMVEGVIKHQLDTLEASRTAENGSRDELFNEWGAQKDAKMADVNNAMRALNLTPVDVAAMQRGFAQTYGEPGSKRTLALLQRLGAGMAEDALLGGDGARRFGITGAEAQAEIDKLIGDTDFQTKLMTKNPAAVARWDRLNAAIAADRDAKARAAAGG